MDKKDKQNLLNHINRVREKKRDVNYIIADMLISLISKTTPDEWDAERDDEQPIILYTLKIPKIITAAINIIMEDKEFTSGFIKEGGEIVKGDFDKQKIMQALCQVVVNKSLRIIALEGVIVTKNTLEDAIKFLEEDN